MLNSGLLGRVSGRNSHPRPLGSAGTRNSVSTHISSAVRGNHSTDGKAASRQKPDTGDSRTAPRQQTKTPASTSKDELKSALAAAFSGAALSAASPRKRRVAVADTPEDPPEPSTDASGPSRRRLFDQSYDSSDEDTPSSRPRTQQHSRSSRPPADSTNRRSQVLDRLTSRSSTSTSSRSSSDRDRDITGRGRHREEEILTAGQQQQLEAAGSRFGRTPRTAAGRDAAAAAAAAPRHVMRPPPSAAAIPVVRDTADDKGTFFSSSTWASLKVMPELIAALRNIGITRPSHVQAESMKAWRQAPSHLLLADQAGSGKTLAYLLPLVQEMRQAEQREGRSTAACSPQLVVLTPTAELAQQVQRVARAISSNGVPFRSFLMTGGEADDKERNKKFRSQKQCLAEGVDLVVSSPGRFLEHLRKGNVNLQRCRAVVLDEVDVLYSQDSAFLEQVEPLLTAAPSSTRFVLVTATIPQHVTDQLLRCFPGMQAAFGPGLHRTAAGLVEELIDCSGGDEITLESGTLRKLQALDKALTQHAAKRAMVFCNKIETCRVVENHLKRSDRQGARHTVLPYHEAVSEPSRKANLTTFLNPISAENELPVVMVCTDRVSRGLDSMFCEHVVLFDFPRDPSEYVRRVGRTARGAGGKGVVSMLLLGKQVPLAQEIVERNQKNSPVHRIPDFMYQDE